MQPTLPSVPSQCHLLHPSAPILANCNHLSTDLIPSCRSVGTRGVIGSVSSVPLLRISCPCKTWPAALLHPVCNVSAAFHCCWLCFCAGRRSRCAASLLAGWLGGICQLVVLHAAAGARLRQPGSTPMSLWRLWWRCRRHHPGYSLSLWAHCSGGDRKIQRAAAMNLPRSRPANSRAAYKLS